MATGERPNPDELLRQVAEEEKREHRGKLTIFFGAAPGVGKTYAMLEAARVEKDEGRDVVIGIVETHGRYDTAGLVIGLELLPRRKEKHRGVEVEELDLDEALARKPSLVLVDELAHTNAPGSRHAKRWQDVDELLDAGIDVMTTLNVQHLESLNDVVAQVTGVVVRETVPDRVLEEASDIRLIDLPPDELLERLEAGKVYLPAQAQRAIDNFFRKGNLIALRELALRRTAESVEAQMNVYKSVHGIEGTWAAAERLLVCVSPSPLSAQLVRGARRMAGSLHAPWIAAYVETPAALRLGDGARKRLAENLRLAEQLGAETITITGENAAQETVRFAKKRNVTKIVVGKPTHSRWRDLVRPPFLDEIVRASGDIDVYVISGEEPPKPAREPAAGTPRRASLAAYAASLAIVAVAGTIGWSLFGRQQLEDVSMVFVLGVVLVALRFGWGPSLVASAASVLAFDFFFVPPFYTFTVSDLRHVTTFAVMFVVAVVISSLTKRVRDQIAAARAREHRTASLYGVAKDLAATRAAGNLVEVAMSHLRQTFGGQSSILLPGADGKLETAGEADKDRAVIEWVWEHGKSAGRGTDTLPEATALYVPLREGKTGVGVLGIRPDDARRFADPDQRALLDVFCRQIAAALERARLAEETQRAQLQIEAERMRSSLLSSVSHDLRTPLAVISGAATALLQPEAEFTPQARHDLLETVHEEAQRLNRLVRNLLDMTRIASGAVRVAKDWHPLDGVVGAALERLHEPLEGRPLYVEIPADLPPVPIDEVLVEQVLINLLENAIKYTPEKSPIRVAARLDGTSEPPRVVVEVSDRGPGVPKDHAQAIFEKFYRLPREREGGGAGLGLAICRGVAEAHGGKIWVEDREGGGASFFFSLPIEGTPPEIDDEGER